MAESETNEQLKSRIVELVPINELPPNLQKKLLERAQILEVKKSRHLFKQGDKDDYSYYLLDGEVELHANKQLDSVIQSTSDRAKYALAQLQPRQFSAKAKTALKVLLVERKHLDQLMLLAQESTLNPTLAGGETTIEVDEVDGVDDDADWMTQMLQSELFSRMPTHNIHQLFALLEPIEFNSGDVVIKQGDPGEHYYIISEGRCAVSRKPSPQSKDVKLAELSVGDSFGEEALISDSTRNATITMITNGVLMQLAKDTFVELVKNPTLQSLKYDEADALVNEGSAKWLDVRFPNEHKEAAIEGSVNVPLNSLRLQLDKLDPKLIYILYCDTGSRSSTGTFLLAERGFDVTYLEGGLVNNSEALGVATEAPQAPEPKPEPAKQATKAEAPAKPAEPAAKSDVSDDADVRVEKINAELETTQIRMARENEAKEQDAAKQKEHEENKKKLEEQKQKLEKEKQQAEAEAKKKAEQEEARLQKIKEESEKQMQLEKQKLEEIYNKNAQDMEKLQKAKEAAEEKIRKERDALEKQAEAARKQIEEAKRLKQEADDAVKKQLEEVEASKKKLEEEAEKKRLEEEERERQLQVEAKAKIDEERKKMAEQYERNAKEIEELKRQKEEAEAAKQAAKEEAQKMIDEYKQSHDQSHAEEQAKLKAERQKLEEEARKIQESMKQIQQARLEAEKIKQEALQQATELKAKQMDSTSSKEQRDKLDVEIKAAEEKAVEAEREIEDAVHREKLTVSAQQVNEADLEQKKKQEQMLRAQIEGDLEDFEEAQEEEKASVTQIQMQSDMMKRIKLKAAEAKKNAAKANENLLDDISKQLGNKD